MDKVWWNELWMGSPLGPEYEASSNVVGGLGLGAELVWRGWTWDGVRQQ